jgi:hypothetical protein
VPPAGDQTGPDSGTADSSTDPSLNLKDHHPAPFVGRHRAAD